MDNFHEENQYLEYTLKVIDEEIANSNTQIDKLKKESISLSFEDRKRGSHLDLNSKLDFNNKKIKNLELSKPKPYFGRMDFFPNDTKKLMKLYIGRSGIFTDASLVVIDWRAPISSLYYENEMGNLSYESPDGIINGNLLVKKQIKIENGKLLDVQDASLVSNDDLLKPYLSQSIDNKMKIIIASIQKEQNEIIRKAGDSNIIVQGVAGSGKTSVALHRIAYLLYNLDSKISAKQFLVLGPNKYFLNYISSILPELETDSVDQKTFLSFLNSYLKDNLNFISNDDKKIMSDDIYKKMDTFKTSLEYKEILNQFFSYYIENDFVNEDFTIDDKVVFSKEEIKQYLFSNASNGININLALNYFKKKFKNDKEKIYDVLNKNYRNIYIALPKNNPVRNEVIQRSNMLKTIIDEDGEKLLIKYFKKINKGALELYKIFILNLHNYELPINKKDSLFYQKELLISLNKKKINFEDIPSLLHIHYLFSKDNVDYKYLVVDEAQDYGIFHFDALKEITNNCKFAIYGDLAQSIYSHKTIDSWEELNKKVFNNSCSILYLNKSYRTTMEITNVANKILEQLELNLAEPVVRNGADVYFSDENDTNNKVDLINKWKDKGYKTTAVICKTEYEAKKTYLELSKHIKEIKYISSKDEKFEGGIVVLTCMAAKGLEFDTVIVNNASNKIYCQDSNYDMHLLYVACTRALHEQIVLYDEEITKIFSSYVTKNNETKKLKR